MANGGVPLDKVAFLRLGGLQFGRNFQYSKGSGQNHCTQMQLTKPQQTAANSKDGVFIAKPPSIQQQKKKKKHRNAKPA